MALPDRGVQGGLNPALCWITVGWEWIGLGIHLFVIVKVPRPALKGM